MTTCHRNNSDGRRSALPTFGKLGLGRATINQMVYIFVYSLIGISDQSWDDIGASTTFLPQASVSLNTALDTIGWMTQTRLIHPTLRPTAAPCIRTYNPLSNRLDELCKWADLRPTNQRGDRADVRLAPCKHCMQCGYNEDAYVKSTL